MLKRHGLVRKGQRKTGFYRVKRGDLTEPEHPNQVWAADFKGWFLLKDGSRCDPLTSTDLYSRYVLCCRALSTLSAPSSLYAPRGPLANGLERRDET